MHGGPMKKFLLTAMVLLTAISVADAAQRLKFWNLTINTIDELYLAPAGTDKWGKNQCLNDPDKSVDPDERMYLSDVTPGKYDVKVSDTKGRTCVLRNVEVKGTGPYAFSIEENEVKNCKK